MREHGEGLGRPRRECLAALSGSKALRIGHRPLEPVPDAGVSEVLEHELVPLAHAVVAVRCDPEPDHVRDDEERGVLEREGVLAQLVERGVEVRVLSLVFPGEAVALPHVGPPVSAGVLAGAALEAVVLADGVGFSRSPLAEQPTQVDEVFLGGRAFLQCRGSPLRDEFAGAHVFPHTAKV